MSMAYSCIIQNSFRREDKKMAAVERVGKMERRSFNGKSEDKAKEEVM